MRTFVYDIETFRPIFSAVFKDFDTGERYIFEVSGRVNQSDAFVHFLWWLNRTGATLIGFNNVHFDWPVCQHLMGMSSFDAITPYLKAQEIFQSQDRFEHVVWDSDALVRQIDLFKIHHFDNMARATSLKTLEFNMRADHIEDLPFDPHAETLAWADHDKVIVYNCHDVDQTERFARESIDAIQMRAELTASTGIDMTNFNDTKIGKQFFIQKLEDAAPGICYRRENGRRQPNQTKRPHIDLGAVILPIVAFQHPELNRVANWLRDQRIRETKGVFDNLSCTVDGFHFDFGTGGIHGSQRNKTFRADATHDIVDVDVTSYYPTLAIANRLYPAHLGEHFADIYAEVFAMRQGTPKGSPKNAMLKLALNGVYGDSNNVYSPFYDPAYTMAITINGQMLLAMLAEQVMQIPDCELIQVNTDGLTCRIARSQRPMLDRVCDWWQGITGLKLESAQYQTMFVRDVNNYVAVKPDGGVKRKGAYEHAVGWHQNHSSLVIARAAEARLIHGQDVADYIAACDDPFDFCRRAKVPRTSRLETTDGARLQNTTRYHIATDGPGLVKIMPPLPRAPDKERHIGIDKGWSVQACNWIGHFDWQRLDRSFYIQEAEKLVDAVGLDP